MFCAKCGLKIPDNIKFCPKCGNRILENRTAGEDLQNATKDMGEQHQFVPKREETKQKYKTALGRKKKIILSLMCTVCCIVVVLLIIRNESKIDELFRNKEPEQAEKIEIAGDTSVLHQYDETYNARNMVDMAGVLSVSEEKELSEYMEKIKKLQNCELVAVIIPHDELNGKTTEEYSDSYYWQNNIGVGSDKSGVLFLAAIDDDGHGDAYVYTSGSAVSAITDDYLDNYFWTDMIPHIKNREYKAAVDYFADQCSGLLALHGNSGSETDGQLVNGNVRDSVFSYNALDYVALDDYRNMNITVDLSYVDTVGEERLTNMAIQQSVRENFKLTSFPPGLVDTVYGYYIAYYMNENGVSTTQELANFFDETEDELHDEFMDITVSEWTSEIILEAIADSEGLQGTEEGLQEYISMRLSRDSVLSEEEYYSKNGMDVIDGKQYLKNCYKGTLATEWIKKNANISYVNTPD